MNTPITSRACVLAAALAVAAATSSCASSSTSNPVGTSPSGSRSAAAEAVPNAKTHLVGVSGRFTCADVAIDLSKGSFDITGTGGDGFIQQGRQTTNLGDQQIAANAFMYWSSPSSFSGIALLANPTAQVGHIQFDSFGDPTVMDPSTMVITLKGSGMLRYQPTGGSGIGTACDLAESVKFQIKQ